MPYSRPKKRGFWDKHKLSYVGIAILLPASFFLGFYLHPPPQAKNISNDALAHFEASSTFLLLIRHVFDTP